MSNEPASEPRGWDGWLSPRQWIPGAGLLGVAIVVLGVLLFVNIGEGDEGPNGLSGGNRQALHEHADFALFIRGEQFDFGQPQFLSTEEVERDPDVHIHDPRHTVVHVHREQTTWDQFFRSLGFELTDPSFPGNDAARTCLKMPDGERLCGTDTETWKFYVNDVKVDGIANTFISDIDRVVLSYGDESEEEVLAQVAQVSNEACIVSERCFDRIPPGGNPTEPCTGRGTCN